MSAASLFADLSIVAGLTAAGAYLIWLMCQGRDDARMSGTWGDFPNVHEELRPPGNLLAGERPLKAGEPVTGGDSHNHREESF